MKKLFLFFSIIVFCTYSLRAVDNASVSWALSSATEQSASLSGQLDNAALNMTGLSVYNYGAPDATMTLMLDGTSTWHTSEKQDCYIEFSISPKDGNRFYANEISVYVCGKGGGNMRANFYYSKDASFATKTQIDYRQNSDLSRDNSAGYDQLNITIDEVIEAGEKLYFRVYPYYKSASTGKYLCLKDMVFSGTTEATDLEASVVWPFISDLKPIVSGALLAEDMSYSSNARQYGWDARVTINNLAVENGTFTTQTTDCKWEASTEPLADTYVQYAVSPKTGATFTVKEISLLIAATGTNNMVAAVFGSKDPTFTTKAELKESTDLVNQELQQWNVILATPDTVSTGETYYLRVYPYHKTSATWKLVGIRNVTISGTTIGATADLPEVATLAAVSYISTETAIGGGSVSNDGGAPVTARGLVWNTSPNATVDNSFSVEGVGAGSFSSTMTNLLAGTTYYVRAYATNKAGTAYGEEISFTTLSELSVPTVVTKGSSNIRNTSVIVSGDVTQWGGADVTEKGFVWGITSNSTDNILKVSEGIGSFQGYIDGLVPQTTYYIRAYAINSLGTAYGNELEVTTKETEPNVIKVVNQDGIGDYTTIQEAFDAVPSSYTGKWIIKIKPGIYNERPSLIKDKVNVFLVGEDAATTVITNNISAGDINPSTGTAWGTSNSQTLAIYADDFMAVNITIENTFVNSKANAAINSNTQAVALKTQGDRQSFYNCRIIGYQDTYLGNSIGRAYFKNCYIEGNVDFIFGRQTVVFDACTTYVNRTGSVITAPSTEKTTKFGMVFLDCDLTAPAVTYTDFNGDLFSDFYYGRPWQNQPRSAFIRCTTPATLNEKGWTTMNAGLDPVFVEYACTGDGATTERLAKRTNGGIVLTATEAESYTVSNIFKKETDPSFMTDWLPKSTPDLDLPLSVINEKYDGIISTCIPNPFMDLFSVNYVLDKDSKVEINLYDMRGMLVAKLLDSKRTAGVHSETFNGADFVAGTYFYVIKTNDGVSSKKVIKK